MGTPGKSTVSRVKKMELAANNLVQENMGLVGYVISKYLNHAYTEANPLYDHDDLFQIGAIGLCKAAENFDASKGVKFDTYAVPAIRNEIYKALRLQRQHEDTSAFGSQLEYTEANVKDETFISDNMNPSFLIADMAAIFKDGERENIEIMLEYLSLGYKPGEAGQKAGLSAAKAYSVIQRIKQNYSDEEFLAA